MTPAENITRAYAGDWHVSHGAIPTASHSTRDRGTTVKDAADGGVVFNSFDDGDWRAVAVAPEAGTYGNLTNYTILTAAGGVTGTFAAATSADATLTPFLAYGANGVTLTLARNDVVFSGMGGTANQVAVGGAVTTLGVNSAVFRGLLPLSNAAVSDALGQLSGELYASLPAVLADGSKQVREAVLARATTPGRSACG